MSVLSTLFPRRRRLILLLLVCGPVLLVGCTKQKAGRSNRTDRSRQRNSSSLVLQRNIAHTLNHLTDVVDLDLTPPKVLLDASKSTDGKTVEAVATVNPDVPDGPVNLITVTSGNVDFRQIGVRPGDVLRYYANYDKESLERGIEQVTHIELRVRRLDTHNPETAVIIEGGLNGPMPIPQRLEVWRYTDKRLNEIMARASRFATQESTSVAWEPTPDERALVQLVERLNQWLRNAADNAPDWVATPLLAGLPPEVTANPAVAKAISEENLAEGVFDLAEARELQSYVWARDISQWAKRDALTDLDVARQLFDWTVRNVQLDADNDPNAPRFTHQTWQALMYGHAAAALRGLVFVELCRQQQIDAVMLSDGQSPPVVGVLADEQILLFDPRLGLPIPGTEPDSVATLAEVVADPGLLRRLDTDGAVYPLGAENLAQLAAWVPATPLQLSKRAARLQAALSGTDSVVFTAQPDAVAERLSSCQPKLEAKLWPGCFEAMIAERSMPPRAHQLAATRMLIFALRPRLWKARTLHFQGTKEVAAAEADDPLAEPRRGHNDAVKLYQDPRIRPADRQLRNTEPGKKIVYLAAKADAAYWLGLLSYDLGRDRVALDWLQRVEGPVPGFEPWAAGKRYNLARCHEALGEIDQAVELLRGDNSAGRPGNLIRAEMLLDEFPYTADEPNEPEPAAQQPEAEEAPADESAGG